MRTVSLRVVRPAGAVPRLFVGNSNQQLRESPQLFRSLAFLRVFGDPENPGEHAGDIAVEDRNRLIEGDAGDGARRVASNPGQIQHVLETFGESTVVIADDDVRRFPEIPRARVIAKPFPKFQHLFRSRAGQRFYSWQFVHPAFPVGNYRFDLGLLEHDFGNPNRVRIVRVPPWQIARVPIEPLEQSSNQAAGIHGICLCLSCTVAQTRATAYDDSTFVKALTSYQCTLAAPEAGALENYLREHGYEFREVPYARFAAGKEKVNVVFYESGKLVVQGKGTQEFVEFVLEPGILKQARIGYETVLSPELLLPRLGVDESGKGDFFGPLCIAGVYVNESVVKAWGQSEIRDSKSISSDRKIAELARLIRETPGCVTSVVPIGNEAYNRLYGSMKSVNSILAWGHARVIENLMGQKHKMNPPPVRAISDQFASNKSTVANALMSLGREIELVQRHKAEADMAVAAASILARNEFVSRMAALEKQFGTALPKGASDAVDAAAREFVAKHGAENLSKVAKMHFRNAFRAQGLPEPPRTEWKRGGKKT